MNKIHENMETELHSVSKLKNNHSRSTAQRKGTNKECKSEDGTHDKSWYTAFGLGLKTIAVTAPV